MLYRITEGPAAWDRASVAAAALVVGEIACAWMMVARSVRLGGGALVLGAAVAIGSVVVLGRCRLPLSIKAALLLALTASVLGSIATQDVLGAREMRAETDATLADAAVHAEDQVRVRAVPGAGSGGDRVAQALEGTIAKRAVTGDAAVSLAPAEFTYDPEHPYRLHWSLERGDDRLWCGDYTVEDRKRPDVSLLADRVSDALAASREGPLKCE